MKPRIAIAGFQHETNTFAPFPTTFEDFERGGGWPGLTKGADVLDTFAPMNIAIGGFIQAAADWDLVPILWTAAEPAGHVSQDAFDRITEMICEGVAGAGQIDGVYLDLHGAMTSDDFEDGEAEVLRRVRAVIGAELPLAVSYDLHGNLTEDAINLASSSTIYRTYPHVDMAETGARSHALLAAELQQGAPFAKAFRALDYLVPLPQQSTMREPGRALYARCPTLEGPGVASVDFAFGFPPADIRNCGMSVIAHGTDDGSRRLGRRRHGGGGP